MRSAPDAYRAGAETPRPAASPPIAVAPLSAASERATAHWARTPERSNAAALRAMCFTALLLGRRVARCILVPITLYFFVTAAAPRRNTLRYLDRALGRPARLWDAWRVFYTFATTVLDRVYLLRDRYDLFTFAAEGGERVTAIAAEGRGAFLLGAHVGSFEALHAVGRTRAELRVAMVLYPDNARLIGEALAAVAPDAHPDIIALGRVDAMLQIRDWLDGGGFAGLLGDRSLPGASARSASVTVSFLGREATFADGPMRLAALLRRRVVFMAGVHEGGARYRVLFDEIADFRERPADAAAREAAIRAAVVAYVARLEALCRAHPYNWFNFHDFWGEDGVSGKASDVA